MNIFKHNLLFHSIQLMRRSFHDNFAIIHETKLYVNILTKFTTTTNMRYHFNFMYEWFMDLGIKNYQHSVKALLTYLLQDGSARKQPYPMDIQAGSEKYQTSWCTLVFRLKVT